MKYLQTKKRKKYTKKNKMFGGSNSGSRSGSKKKRK